jgi:hypothetical protein
MNLARRIASLPLLVAFAAPSLATAATLRVSNAGIDDPSCGIKAPCRSLRLAIANAKAGDTIEVGPGLYAPDLDHDNVFEEPGEESRSFVEITKPLTITSTFGASSTVIRHTVGIFQPIDVVLGRPGHGFTISDEDNPLLIASGVVTPVSVVFSGNVVVNEGRERGGAVAIVLNTVGRIEDNRFVGGRGCPVGLLLLGEANVVAERNSVVGCEIGFSGDRSPGVRLIHNAAIGNSYATATGIGFDLPAGAAEFSGNVSVGNGIGVRVFGDVPILRNNAFVGSISNCGISYGGVSKLVATDNWWGAPTGPGPDPADGVCNTNGGVTITTPFLTTDPSVPLEPR